MPQRKRDDDLVKVTLNMWKSDYDWLKAFAPSSQGTALVIRQILHGFVAKAKARTTVETEIELEGVEL